MQSESSFGVLISDVRKKNGVLQKDLADQVGCTVSHLNRIERGAVSPSLALLCKIFSMLGIREFPETAQPQKPSSSKRLSPLVAAAKDLNDDDLDILLALVQLMKGNVLTRRPKGANVETGVEEPVLVSIG